jgi:hypothetical protein
MEGEDIGRRRERSGQLEIGDFGPGEGDQKFLARSMVMGLGKKTQRALCPVQTASPPSNSCGNGFRLAPDRKGIHRYTPRTGTPRHQHHHGGANGDSPGGFCTLVRRAHTPRIGPPSSRTSGHPRTRPFLAISKAAEPLPWSYTQATREHDMTLTEWQRGRLFAGSGVSKPPWRLTKASRMLPFPAFAPSESLWAAIISIGTYYTHAGFYLGNGLTRRRRTRMSSPSPLSRSAMWWEAVYRACGGPGETLSIYIRPG